MGSPSEAHGHGDAPCGPPDDLRIWRWENQCGAEAPPDVERRLVVAEWLWDEGTNIADCTDAEVTGLVERMRFCRLYSVVKRDHEHLDPDDCGGFHSEGSGKRSMDAWFIDTASIYGVADAVVSRRSESRAAEPTKSVGIGPDSTRAAHRENK